MIQKTLHIVNSVSLKVFIIKLMVIAKQEICYAYYCMLGFACDLLTVSV